MSVDENEESCSLFDYPALQLNQTPDVGVESVDYLMMKMDIVQKLQNKKKKYINPGSIQDIDQSFGEYQVWSLLFWQDYE